MTNDQKQTIQTMRSQGIPISRIAADVGLSANTVKAFYRREQNKKEFCKHCRKPLEQLPGRKPKTYCNNECRYAWWKSHRHLMKHEAVYTYTCAHCGREFDSLGKNRKYCGHPCYIADRFKPP